MVLQSRGDEPAQGRLPVLLVALLSVSVAGLAGCLERPSGPAAYGARSDFGHDVTGLDPTAWPDLNGTITVLDNGAFTAFDQAAAQFQALTGVHVKQEPGGDGVKALNTLIQSKASGKYDVIYGLDNMLVGKAVRDGVLVPYQPIFSNRIDPALIFFPQNGSWYATPVDHGYIGLNVDAGAEQFNGTSIIGLGDVRHYADQFVTEDPTISTPGLGFLMSTIAAFPERPAYSANRYDWHDYWTDLLTGRDTDRNHDGIISGCALVVENWGVAYEQDFSAAGAWVGASKRDKPIVTSYTESPAYEASGGMERSTIGQVVLEANSTFHQIQTMAIAKGTTHLEAAQAWVEFTLTDFFQGLAAPQDAVYPVVSSISVESTYHGVDPRPGSFVDAKLSYTYITANMERWLKEWTQLHEKYSSCHA